MNITKWADNKTTVLPSAKLPADFISDNDIIPEDMQNRLQYWRDTFRVGQFDIGDITAEIIRNVALSGKSIPEIRVFQAVGHFCGKSARTVRYYYETAIFYSRDWRMDYDMLPFSHFVVARKLCKVHSHKDILDYSMLHPGMSAEALENYFRFSYSGSGRVKPIVVEAEVVPSEAPDDDDYDDDYDGTWDGVIHQTSQDIEYGAISNLNACIYALGEVVKAMPAIELKSLSDERKDALVATMNVLKRDLTAIMQSLAEKTPH